MADSKEKDPGIKPEDLRGEIPEKELIAVTDTYVSFYKWKAFRSGLIRNFQNYTFEDMLVSSRELFWNSITTKSPELSAMGMNLSIPFARKETLDFLGRITSLNIKPRLSGDSLDSIGMKMLNGMYTKWRFHSNDKVEKFWEMLYGLVNGTVCSYIGYNNTKMKRRYLRTYDYETGTFDIETKEETYWNDVWKEIVPIEDMYLPKIYERNFQKQGRCIWKTQMDEEDFHAMYDDKYPNAKFAISGNRIAEDSLYYRLLGGSGTTSYNKIEILRDYNWITDEYKMCASGILLNGLGTKTNYAVEPMPFDHKMGPFTWGITSPLDNNLCYGLPTPFLVKDPHKILNVGYTMMIERELRSIDPPILSSDIESPELIYGQHKVIPVNDVAAYKELKLSEASNQYFAMLNSLQSQMTAQAQGGNSEAVPSRQPNSAAEENNNESQEQEAMSNTVVMYYDLIRQEILLVLKTMFQFYTSDKYESADKRVYRQLLIPDQPLSQGGTGDLKIRIVKKKQTDMDLWLEAIKESKMNNRETEIIEVPLGFLQGLEFNITKIELDPDQSDDIELANFVTNVIQPMLNVYVPAGVADINKVFLRHLEKMKESPADFIKDNGGQQVGQGVAAPGQPGLPVAPGGTPQPDANGPTGQANVPAVLGNNKQSIIGQKFGGQKSKGLPTTKQK